MMCNGMLAGLVAITAPVRVRQQRLSPCSSAPSPACWSSGGALLRADVKIDDPVGAIAVHGVNGAWGVLSLGLFADGTYGDGWNGVPGTVKGLFYGDASQFVAQCVGTRHVHRLGVRGFYIFFKVLDGIVGNRVSAEVELEGLDMPEMGALGYPEFVMTQGPTAGGIRARRKGDRRGAHRIRRYTVFDRLGTAVLSPLAADSSAPVFSLRGSC